MEEKITRFGVSIDESLLSEFDDFIRQRQYTNRSEAIRDLIRKSLVENEWQSTAHEVIGTLTLVYDHHVPNLSDRLNRLQHEHLQQILLSSHIHLDHHNCLEVLIVRGLPDAIRSLADKIASTRGVKHATLSMTTTGTRLS